MKISFNWLKDYVDIELSPQALAKELTISGTEVTSISTVGADKVFEMEITSNRSDCLSHIGIAREVAAITGKKLKLPKIVKMIRVGKSVSSVNRENRIDCLSRQNIKIEDKKGCLRYIGILIKDVDVGDSPKWLRQRLEAVGLRSVNNIVDISNFCLLEWGQPLHAFDFDKLLNHRIIVRRAANGEKIITIDGIVRNLDPEILVIADSQKPIAIAGLMGGLNTEVTKNTKNILLESAYFDPVMIRRASRKLGLSTESSYRFERNVDVEGVVLASMRATGLICDLAKGEFVKKIDIQTKSLKQDKKIQIDPEKVNRILGIRIPTSKIKTTFKRLGFRITKIKKNSLEVKIPSFRQDVSLCEDLIEEIARIFGYENIPSILPAIKPSQIESESLRQLKDRVRAILIAKGLNEIISYSLIGREQLKRCKLDFLQSTDIANPLSRDQEILRPTIVSGLLNCLNYNLSRNIEDIKIFEIGNIFEGIQEVPVLSIALTGARYRDWLRKTNQLLTIFDLKGIIESMLESLGIQDYKFSPKVYSFFEDGYSLILAIRGKQIGFLGQVSNEVLNNWKIKKDKIFITQLKLDGLVKFMNLERKFKPLALYPSIKRDISFLAREDISSEDIVEVIKKEAGMILKDVKLIDYYHGHQIPTNFKSLTYFLEYQAQNRTLKDEEINQIQDRIIQVLEGQLDIRVRR
jgi:phenylalanyl-tRNA synthetase beta chain